MEGSPAALILLLAVLLEALKEYTCWKLHRKANLWNSSPCRLLVVDPTLLEETGLSATSFKWDISYLLSLNTEAPEITGLMC